ncbi:MAG: hypothetical protein U0744_11130 [Gemmataceae bacterium]
MPIAIGPMAVRFQPGVIQKNRDQQHAEDQLAAAAGASAYSGIKPKAIEPANSGMPSHIAVGRCGCSPKEQSPRSVREGRF